jgi:hypothetical protein
MKAIEFIAHLEKDMLTIPNDICAQLSENQRLRVILLLDDPDEEERDYQKLNQEQFLKGYAEIDSIYDNY